MSRALILHLTVLAGLLALNWVLPAYHHTNLARIMVLAAYATGFNIAFGYTGLLSLGHALFFAAGIYGAGLTVDLMGWSAMPGLLAALAAGGAVALATGMLALRTTGVAFMIVTLMFAQAGYLTTLYFDEITRGEEGFVIARAARAIAGYDLADPTARYLTAWTLFAIGLLIAYRLAVSPMGRVLVAIRENEPRTRMLGYDPFRYRLAALVISGLYAGAAGGLYALLFGYVGSTFASIQYSIFPLLWVLVGGAATVLGPFLGTLAMFYLIDIASGYTSAHMVVVGAALVVLILTAPKGILGSLRTRLPGWLP